MATSEATAEAEQVMLWPAEQRFIQTATVARQREFATGRQCARAALALLGYPPAPILPDDRRCPIWPAGALGSITHCPGYRAAAVGLDSDIRSLGVDAEPNACLSDRVLRAIASPAEREHLRELGLSLPQVCWDRLLFSAKEALYKAWYRLDPSPHTFTDVEVTFAPGPGSFQAAMIGWRWPEPIGRFAVHSGLLVTASLVP